MRTRSLRSFASGSLIGAAIVCLALAIDAPDEEWVTVITALAVLLACALGLHASRMRSIFANSSARPASAIIAPRQSMKPRGEACSEVSQRACSSVG